MEAVSRACANLVARRLSHWFACASQPVTGALIQGGITSNLQNINPACSLKLTTGPTTSAQAHTIFATRIRTLRFALHGRGHEAPGEAPSTVHSTPWQFGSQRGIHVQSPVWVLAKPGSYVTLNNLRDNPGATRKV